MSPVRRWGSPCLFPLQLFSLCWVLSVAQSKTVRYSTFEEDAPGTVIGTLAEDLHMKVSGDTSFRLMKQFNSSLLRVREGDGQLTVGDAGLDRERLCGQAPQCVLAFDVVSFSQEQFRLVHVEVEVRDVNDHAPRFPRAQIPVEVSEGAAVGTRIPLEVPVDEDVGANGLQTVRLAEPHSPFRVELQTRADGAQCADLVLLQELDRESQAAYSLELVAQDGGRPPRSATAALSVRVLDANDHSPAFPQGAVAEVELAEDAPVGSLLLDLDAADPDEGPNGDVVFAFGARTPPEARRLFRLDPRSGRLTLAGPVDYERQDTYELDVRAQDRGPGPRAATCKVIVRIRDVNDNAPDIAITPLAAPGAPATSPFAAAAAAAALGGADASSPAGAGTPEAGATSLVPEGAARESLVALVSTSDRDSGANGQVRCALYGHEHFRLQPAYAGSYLVVTAASLDRERIAEYNLTLVAEDRGAPPLRTVRPYTVRVGDENDNAPLFTRPVYEVSVRENNPPGAYLATVAARDRDLGRNGQVTYRLLEAEVGRAGGAVSTYVSVDPATGAIYALRSFDYETLRQLDVRIQASDGGSPQLSSSALVQVRVLDQNDHAPVLVHPAPANGSLEVAVPGRTAKDTVVARVQARDADEGANGELAFELQQQEPREAFAIGRRTGEILLTGDLSQEPPGRVFRALLVISDGGRPPLTTTATVSFVVTAGGGRGPAAPASAGSPERSRPPGSRLGVSGSVLQWDTPLIVIIVLAGSCTLLLAAIIAIATTCNRRKKEPYGASPGFGKEPAPPVAVWKGHSFNTISGREAEKFSGKDSGKGDSDFNDSDSDISGDALKKDLINHMQSGLWACTAECKILGHSDRCWSPSCSGPNAHPSPHPPAQMSTFCKSTSLPRDPLRRDNYYQAQLPKTVGLQSVYEKVLHRDYDRTVTLLSPPRPGRLPDLQEIGVPLYQSPPGRYLSPKKGANENV
ncbi:protocadherin 8 [Homo sapiens]|uniref:Isoform 2 of Protocadherin-8 n=1 Tax=Homo sapiens TaxID=9606 RepID=O95206-2|nr:protocadherin-8 isoform 2 precursor [Homo sapiens]EAW52050.1 protocadherin 8, isoform CRA_b [Homo sapiens]EAW52051.1 protocadherin 8, isoform CRA_b [Homo sapiens]KAI4063448.1 protocadherin 8 [Homo sapiens]|eukprot:NP_116567.1 protocadherin-8 isoform 2 precursor [Homo sapiens]